MDAHLTAVDGLNGIKYKSDYIAIGEIGLDFYWSREFEKEQLEAFEKQVEWACETGLPLMIHCRKAQNEMLHILRKWKINCQVESFTVLQATSRRLKNY